MIHQCNISVQTHLFKHTFLEHEPLLHACLLMFSAAPCGTVTAMTGGDTKSTASHWTPASVIWMSAFRPQRVCLDQLPPPLCSATTAEC